MPVERVTTADQISDGIIKTSEVIGVGIGKASKFTAEKLSDYSKNYISTTKPNETPTQISSSTKSTISTAKTVTDYTMRGVGTIAGWIGTGAKKAGAAIGEYVEETYLSDSNNDNSEESNMAKACKIGGATLGALGILWNSLEDNLTDVARTTRVETVKCVTHKYGDDAGSVTDDGFRAAINGTKTVFYLDSLGMKAIAKKTAKTAGKTAVKAKAARSLEAI